MRISGFTMVRNADKLYYPIKESILSILPLVDEFVVALGDCDADDRTGLLIKSINSPKIRILNTKWDLQRFPRGMEHAHQTDIAKDACTGDWLFYLQADEVVHEDDLPLIKSRCQQLLHDDEVEGFLFKYLHFWGDYFHHHRSHGWYPFEIRIIRNNKEIHSWQSAQSFRKIPHFDGLNYRTKKGTKKLKVAMMDATIFHYGYVRPPDFMQRKRKTFDSIHHGAATAGELYEKQAPVFDYGALGCLKTFSGSHPKVMRERIESFNWPQELNYSKKAKLHRPKYKHEKIKYKILSAIEDKLFNGKELFGFKNYKLLAQKE